MNFKCVVCGAPACYLVLPQERRAVYVGSGEGNMCAQHAAKEVEKMP